MESLLAHWETRTPCGPCHYGIGTRFLKTEYPFLRYNLFYYVYVLFFYPAGRGDDRFHDALDVLRARLDDDGRFVVEERHRGLKGAPMGLAFAPDGRLFVGDFASSRLFLVPAGGGAPELVATEGLAGPENIVLR